VGGGAGKGVQSPSRPCLPRRPGAAAARRGGSRVPCSSTACRYATSARVSARRSTKPQVARVTRAPMGSTSHATATTRSVTEGSAAAARRLPLACLLPGGCWGSAWSCNRRRGSGGRCAQACDEVGTPRLGGSLRRAAGQDVQGPRTPGRQLRRAGLLAVACSHLHPHAASPEALPAQQEYGGEQQVELHRRQLQGRHGRGGVVGAGGALSAAGWRGRGGGSRQDLPTTGAGPAGRGAQPARLTPYASGDSLRAIMRFMANVTTRVASWEAAGDARGWGGGGGGGGGGSPHARSCSPHRCPCAAARRSPLLALGAGSRLHRSTTHP
jgi:hypothetical protein